MPLVFDNPFQLDAPYDAPSPLGQLHVLAPPVAFSGTALARPSPGSRGSSAPAWAA
jgi:hypothetical protein